MKFYSIWTKLCSFGLKNSNKKALEIRDMGSKKIDKMINIQKITLKFKFQ